ncbi:diguanylate cyclase (GGDEF) domain-containing protein [Prauserella alba]|nr:diguanylate cyclase (GGDEF) domain-containing protein [Prauserella alba]
MAPLVLSSDFRVRRVPVAQAAPLSCRHPCMGFDAVGGDAVTPAEPVHDTAALVDAHESLAGAFAEQGDWRSAYEHLRSALGHARNLPVAARIPEQYRREVEQLRHESLTDALTGVYNRRYLDRTLPWLEPVAVALVDLDEFKSVNDRFGHEVGDRVLRQVARILRQSLPPGGFCARYGGEEFVLVVPVKSQRTVAAIVERARMRVEQFPWRTVEPELTVTISAGVSPADGDAETRLRIADELLYQAKRGGRNSVALDRGEGHRVMRTLSAHTARPHS